MKDWAKISDAYGSAGDVPELIQRWARSQNGEEALTDLWSRLCHQGTVYPASFAALPLLIDVARQHNGKKRRDSVILAGSIVASTDVHCARPQEVAALLPELAHLTELCLTDSEVDDGEFVYLLQALAGAREDPVWGEELSRLVGEEFEGTCESCGRALLFAIGSRGDFAAAEDYVAKPDTRRVPIVPAEPDRLPAGERWLEKASVEHGRTKVARGLRHIFGTTRCLACDEPLRVDLSIKFFRRKMLSNADRTN